MKMRILMAASLLLVMSGCTLKEIKSKFKTGTEWRHSGSRRSNRVRYLVQQGLDFKWSNDYTTGVTYRRRDDDDGSGDWDNGVWFNMSFPIWKKKSKPDNSADRIAALEQRLADLEGQLRQERNDAN